MRKASNRATGADFKESVILPLDMYNQFCKVPDRNTLPVDLKVKLGDQKAWARRQVGQSKPKIAYLQSDPSKRKIANLMSKIKFSHPFLEDILSKYIQRYPEQIDWQPDTYAIILDGRVVPKSNLLRSLHYLLAPEAFDYRRPIGAGKLREKLLAVGVNEGWLYDEQFENAGNTRPPKVGKTAAKTTEFETALHTQAINQQTPQQSRYGFATNDKDFITPTTGWLTSPRQNADNGKRTSPSSKGPSFGRGRGRTTWLSPSSEEPSHTRGIGQTSLSHLSAEPTLTRGRGRSPWLSPSSELAGNKGRETLTRKRIKEASDREKGIKWNASSSPLSPISSRTRKHKGRVRFKKKIDWVSQ